MRRRRPRDVATFAAPLQCVARRHGGAVARTVCVLDAVPLGFPIADVFRATFVGPSVNEVAAAIAGGTVGVMGTIIALETGRQRAVERKQCPYCRTSWRSSSNRISRFLTAAREGGTGKLPCGKCCALGVVPAAEIVGAQKPCEQCRNGYLRCNHCEGDGRLIPVEYEQAIRAQYEDYVYGSRTEDYYQDGPPYV